jgi:tetratricopeptide (TPR) repeat protein
MDSYALAMMDHPNIAKVLDAGATDTGRPYFVMELVRGIPITDYCDREQLSIPERLELFVLVCRAVQHAHQKGIIHRDLKPSNILVTVIDGAPVPKVIDFGVAKATGASLTDRTIYTAFHQFVGTPLYMSPEQADLSGMDMDTRSDIYSLGVLLYELLTGTTPFDQDTFRQAAFDEIRRMIREDEPPRPSTRLSSLGETRSTVSANRKADARHLDRAVQGDLDWIVMKALEKDRRRRYETANDFASDVMRHLTDQTVEACPPSATYRLAKYARRHRVILLTATLVGLALVGGMGVSIWQAGIARRAQHRAEAARDLANAAEARAKASELIASKEAAVSGEVRRFLQHDLLQQATYGAQLNGGFAPKPGLTVKEALQRAAERIGDRFKAQPLIEAEIRMTIAQALGGVGEPVLAAEQLGRAYALRREHLGLGHADTLMALETWAVACRVGGQFDKALDLHARLVELCRAGGTASPRTLEDALDQYGFACYLAGKHDQADEVFRESIRISRQKGRPPVFGLVRLARNLLAQDRPEESELAIREAIALIEQHGYTGSHLHISRSLLGDALARQGKFTEAEPLLIEGYEGMKRFEDPWDGPGSWRTHEALERLACYYEATNQAQKAASLRSQLSRKE